MEDYFAFAWNRINNFADTYYIHRRGRYKEFENIFLLQDPHLSTTDLNTESLLIFLTTMTHHLSQGKPSTIFGNQFRNWTVIVSIIISLLYIIVSNIVDVTAQSTTTTTDNEFLNNFIGLTNKSGALTNSYQQEIGKWENNQYSNTTIMMITNDTIVQINNLIDETNNLQVPEKFKDGISLYTKSLESERDSYKQFGDFIKTGNPALNETSTDLLTDSLKYEIEAFKAIQNPQ